MTTYNFEKACDLGRLQKEIAESAIITAIDHITGTQLSTTVHFKAELSTGDEAILNAIVTAHVNTPLPDNEIKTVELAHADPETGGVKLTPKFAPDGWHQQYFETEFETCTQNSIHEKLWTDLDIGFSSLKFYKMVSGEEVECTDQADIDANCIRTDLLWMPTYDYAIKSGFIAQKQVPSENIYVWAMGGDIDAVYEIPATPFAEGGINLQYQDARTRSGLDGVSATMMYYSHPALGAGKGTNRIRFVCRHSAGFKHRIQAVFELFVA